MRIQALNANSVCGKSIESKKTQKKFQKYVQIFKFFGILYL